MHLFWRLLRFLPQKPMDAIKRHTSADWRLWVRERFGGGAGSIPDQIITVGDGRQFRIGPDYIYLPLHIGRDFEPEASSVARRLVRKGDTVLDIGANYGWYTTLFAGSVGPSGRVHAFEPVPSTFQRLLEHLTLNGCDDRVVAVRAAVGDCKKMVDVHLFEGSSHSLASLSALGRTAFETVQTPMITLDDYLAREGVNGVDFLKCDVEGSEMMVLRGCRGLLSSPDAPIVLVELNDETSAAFGFERADLWDLLSRAGYDGFYAIDGMESIRPLCSVDEIHDLSLLLCGKAGIVRERMSGRGDASSKGARAGRG